MPQTIFIAGTDCYKLAAKYLNDASQFWRIMAQNKLVDPQLTGVPVKIVIPDIDATKTGGVPAQ